MHANEHRKNFNRCETHPDKIVKRFDVSAICDRLIWDFASRSSFFYSTL